MLRGKDYCNCDHVQMFRDAVEDAHTKLVRYWETPEERRKNIQRAIMILSNAMAEDMQAGEHYEND